MIDLLLLAGVALCVLSVLMAVIAVAQTRAPRGAAIALVLGLVALFAGNFLDDRPLTPETLAQSWARLTSGESFGTAPVPEAPAPEAPAAAPAAVPEPTPEPAPAPTESAPAPTEPAPAQ